MPEAQAEVVATENVNLMVHFLATKADLQAMAADLETKIELVRKDLVAGDESLRQAMVAGDVPLRQALLSLEYRLIVKLVASMTAVLAGYHYLQEFL